MKFHTDQHFCIGHSHYLSGKPCQDYALSYSAENFACVVVCDGCSTGKRTDIGARILGLSVLQFFKEREENGLQINNDKDIYYLLKSILADRAHMLKLENSDLLSTCIFVCVNNKRIISRVFGDGVVAVKFRDGSIKAEKYEWINNAPLYLSYSEKDIKQLEDIFHKGENHPPFSIEIKLSVDVPPIMHYLDLMDAMYGVRTFLDLSFNNDEFLKEIEFISVFSDGIAQFNNCHWMEVVEQCMAFKNTTGEFLKRRIMKVIKNCQRNNKYPIDDVSCSVVKIKHD